MFQIKSFLKFEIQTFSHLGTNHFPTGVDSHKSNCHTSFNFSYYGPSIARRLNLDILLLSLPPYCCSFKRLHQKLKAFKRYWKWFPVTLQKISYFKMPNPALLLQFLEMVDLKKKSTDNWSIWENLSSIPDQCGFYWELTNSALISLRNVNQNKKKKIDRCCRSKCLRRCRCRSTGRSWRRRGSRSTTAPCTSQADASFEVEVFWKSCQITMRPKSQNSDSFALQGRLLLNRK